MRSSDSLDFGAEGVFATASRFIEVFDLSHCALGDDFRNIFHDLSIASLGKLGLFMFRATIANFSPLFS